MSEPIHPRELLAVLFRHKKKALFAGFLVVFATLVVTAIMQPRFRSEAMLFVRLGRENVALDPTASIGGGSIMAVPTAREDEINSVVEVLGSRAVAERVVDQIGPEVILGRSQEGNATPSRIQLPAWLASTIDHGKSLLGPELSTREQAVLRFEKLLQVRSPKRSTVVYVSYDGPSPEIAQQAVAKLVELYLEEHVRLNRTAGSHNFFVEQTDQIRHQLTTAESQLRDLKNQTGMAAIEEQRTILVGRIGRLEDDLLADSAALHSLGAELAAINEKLDRLPETRVSQRVSGIPNQAVDLMRQQLYSLQLKEQELLSTFKEEARQVQEIRRQIAEAQIIMAKEVYERTQSTNSADPTFQQLHLNLHSKQTEAASLRARVEKSREQLALSKVELSQLNDNELRVVQLRREVELQESSYRKYAENLEQARIDQALKLERISNIGVAQPASLEPRQVRPQVALQFLAGLVAALVAGLGVALVAENFDRTLRTAEDVARQLDIVPLVSIPVLPPERAQFPPLRESHAHARPR